MGQKQRFYIVAQSAKDNMNANIFWQCVWEADVYLLIQLSDELTYVPNNSDKCLEYGQVRLIDGITVGMGINSFFFIFIVSSVERIFARHK